MTQAAEDANTIHSTSQPETTTIQTLDAELERLRNIPKRAFPSRAEKLAEKLEFAAMRAGGAETCAVVSRTAINCANELRRLQAGAVRTHLSEHETSAVIWYTITKTPQATWHNFAKQVMKAMQEPEFLQLIVLLYNDTYQPTPAYTWQQREALLAALKLLEN